MTSGPHDKRYAVYLAQQLGKHGYRAVVVHAGGAKYYVKATKR